VPFGVLEWLRCRSVPAVRFKVNHWCSVLRVERGKAPVQCLVQRRVGVEAVSNMLGKT